MNKSQVKSIIGDCYRVCGLWQELEDMPKEYAYLKEKAVEAATLAADVLKDAWHSCENGDFPPLIHRTESDWDFSEDVICYLANGDYTIGHYEHQKSTNEKYWILENQKDDYVTHWMHRPMPLINNRRKL